MSWIPLHSNCWDYFFQSTIYSGISGSTGTHRKVLAFPPVQQRGTAAMCSKSLLQQRTLAECVFRHHRSCLDLGHKCGLCWTAKLLTFKWIHFWSSWYSTYYYIPHMQTPGYPLILFVCLMLMLNFSVDNSVSPQTDTGCWQLSLCDLWCLK